MGEELKASDGLGVWTDGEDWYVALSAEGVRNASREFTGGYEPADFDPTAWRRVSDDAMLIVRDDDGGKVTMTAGEWVMSNGPGFLGSVNY